MRYLTIVALLALIPRPSDAQTCLGQPGYTKGRIHLAAGADVGNDAKSFGGGIGVGAPKSVFGQVSAEYLTYDAVDVFDTDPTGPLVTAGIGYQIPLGERGNAEFCPLVEVASLRVKSAVQSESLTLSQNLFNLGGVFGYTLPSSVAAVTPFVGISYERFSAEVKGGGEELDLGTDSYTPAVFGIGLGFPSFGITGAVTIPIGLDGADPSFGVRFIVPLGAR